jgi:hypothetical protein
MTSLRSLAKARILNELVEAVQKQSAASSTGLDQWKVLVVDETTLPILSHACKISDLSDLNISGERWPCACDGVRRPADGRY